MAKQKDPKVTVFGGNIDTNKWEKHGSQGVVWGGLLVFVGTIVLLNTFGVVSWNVWEVLVNFWPVLLILFGFQVLLGAGSLSRLIMILLAIAGYGLVLLYILQTPYPNLLNEFPPEVKDAVQYIDSLNK